MEVSVTTIEETEGILGSDLTCGEAAGSSQNCLVQSGSTDLQEEILERRLREVVTLAVFQVVTTTPRRTESCLFTNFQEKK